MSLLDAQTIFCPYCGESIIILIDPSILQQNYVEDCSVCCRPITLEITLMGEGIAVTARREDEC
ncbi:CPXCG motif-containing cysteine-rich protein [endosymbiont of Ridgeia piscesae]|uniref:CPXCG motif-containing cysteine-rich protein n=1 Tax=endosymbiont of Ridgeia piscesae TaxID=54398 RepID=UPI0009EC0E58|nr:CPXCG motif-containing cysteine-rich protein [endosymbiont of Ridgeia piscesae]